MRNWLRFGAIGVERRAALGRLLCVFAALIGFGAGAASLHAQSTTVPSAASWGSATIRELVDALDSEDVRIRGVAREALGDRVVELQDKVKTKKIDVESMSLLQFEAVDGLLEEQFQKTPRGWIGVTFEKAPRNSYLKEIDRKYVTACVKTVNPLYPSAKVLQRGDEIATFNNVDVSGIYEKNKKYASFGYLVGGTNSSRMRIALEAMLLEPGEIVTLGVIRDGKKLAFDVELGRFDLRTLVVKKASEDENLQNCMNAIWKVQRERLGFAVSEVLSVEQVASLENIPLVDYGEEWLGGTAVQAGGQADLDCQRSAGYVELVAAMWWHASKKVVVGEQNRMFNIRTGFEQQVRDMLSEGSCPGHVLGFFSHYARVGGKGFDRATSVVKRVQSELEGKYREVWIFQRSMFGLNGS